MLAIDTNANSFSRFFKKYINDTVPEALTVQFLRNFRKLTAKNTTKLGN